MLRFREWLQEKDEDFYTNIGHSNEPWPRTLWIWSGGKLIVKKVKENDKRGNTHDYVFSNRTWTYQGRYSTVYKIVSITDQATHFAPKIKLPPELRAALVKRFPNALLKGFGGVKV